FVFKILFCQCPADGISSNIKPQNCFSHGIFAFKDSTKYIVKKQDYSPCLFKINPLPLRKFESNSQ
ncbi:MAG TPA: hypothetical protein PKW69_05835, partial [Niabella sp.]|nr:hypothetical protein [Niabella sp.]